MYTCSTTDRYEYDVWHICIEEAEEKASMIHDSIKATWITFSTRPEIVRFTSMNYVQWIPWVVVGEMLTPCIFVSLHLSEEMSTKNLVSPMIHQALVQGSQGSSPYGHHARLPPSPFPQLYTDPISGTSRFHLLPSYHSQK